MSNTKPRNPLVTLVKTMKKQVVKDKKKEQSRKKCRGKQDE